MRVVWNPGPGHMGGQMATDGLHASARLCPLHRGGVHVEARYGGVAAVALRRTVELAKQWAEEALDILAETHRRLQGVR